MRQNPIYLIKEGFIVNVSIMMALNGLKNAIEV